MFRFSLLVLTALVALSVHALPETFPNMLEGEWAQSESTDHGTIKISITEKREAMVWGILTLTGSRYCKEPIPFRGTGKGNTATIEGDAPRICGYRGKLRGYVTRKSDTHFIGAFTYTWFGIVWASGTFHLAPKK